MVMNGFGNRNLMQSMEKLSMHSKCLDLFSFKFWVGGGGMIFFIFLCSQYVPFKFPMDSHQVPNVFPIAPCFSPICFAQSPPLLTYIPRPKGLVHHLSTESSILGPSIVSIVFFVMGQSNWLIAKNKSWICKCNPN
jgi:hypothetical protein